MGSDWVGPPTASTIGVARGPRRAGRAGTSRIFASAFGKRTCFAIVPS
jgi:hypothetical protein